MRKPVETGLGAVLIPYPLRRLPPKGKRKFSAAMSSTIMMAARTAAAEGEVAWPFCPHSGDGTQRGIADTSSSSVTPALCGHVTVVLQLQELARCGGSHGPVVVLPAPRERSSCHAEKRPKRQ